jgi:hypothetical protein
MHIQAIATAPSVRRESATPRGNGDAGLAIAIGGPSTTFAAFKRTHSLEGRSQGLPLKT